MANYYLNTSREDGKAHLDQGGLLALDPQDSRAKGYGETVRHLVGETFYPGVYVLVAEHQGFKQLSAVAVASYDDLRPHMENAGPIENWYFLDIGSNT